MVLAIKFYNDFYLNNLMFAKIGGIPLEEMNQLEQDFL